MSISAAHWLPQFLMSGLLFTFCSSWSRINCSELLLWPFPLYFRSWASEILVLLPSHLPEGFFGSKSEAVVSSDFPLSFLGQFFNWVFESFGASAAGPPCLFLCNFQVWQSSLKHIEWKPNGARFVRLSYQTGQTVSCAQPAPNLLSLTLVKSQGCESDRHVGSLALQSNWLQHGGKCAK